MKNYFISVIAGLIIVCVGFTAVYAAVEQKNIAVNYGVSGISVQDEVITWPEGKKPFIYNGTVYAPVNELMESLGGYAAYDERDSSVSVNSTDKAKVRLLLEAMKNVGATSPENVIDIWSNGMKSRNAAMQLSVMTEPLKEFYIRQLDESDNYDFWITGVSSPWIEDYEILAVKDIQDGGYEYEIKYNTRTSEGSYHFLVSLKIIKDGNFWRIMEIAGDEDSKNYTGIADYGYIAGLNETFHAGLYNVYQYFDAIKDKRFEDAYNYRYFQEEYTGRGFRVNKDEFESGDFDIEEYSVGNGKRINDSLYSWEVSFKAGSYPESTATIYVIKIDNEWGIVMNPKVIIDELNDKFSFPDEKR